MSEGWVLQLGLFLAILTIIAIVLGEYMARVFDGKPNILSPLLVPVENFLYRIFGINPKDEMDWKSYAVNVTLFSLIGIIFLFLLQELQGFLPLNPQNFHAVRWDTAVNTAISFITNTDWQAYPPEKSMSYLTQMLGMGLQNFFSAAVGMAVAVAFIRGFIRQSTYHLGNFWVILTRIILYILLPLSIIFALILVSQGVVQNIHPAVTAQGLEGHSQVIVQGPAASQVAIKHLGSNGGGFFNTNSAHPYENPTPLSDYLELFASFMIVAAFPFAFGAMFGSRRQGWAIFLAMMCLFLFSLSISIWSEFHSNPILERAGITQGVNAEGKELRFGELSPVVFANVATTTSAGAANSSLDSLMPLTSLMLIFNMAKGEAAFGGVGTGFINMSFYAILTMFLIGLMIGRTPEIFGKKLELYEMVMVAFSLFIPAILQLTFTSIAVSFHADVSTLGNPGAHGLSSIVHAFASGAANNGSAMASLHSDTPFYNLVIALLMLVGRFISFIPSLAIAGSLAMKRASPLNARFPTASAIFILVLVLVVIIVGELTFLPEFVLGPILEHMYIFPQ